MCQIIHQSSFQITNDPAIINYDQRFKQNQETVIYNKYQSEDRPDDPLYDPKTFEAPVMVRSNTIEGDRTHPRGMVVARILKGNFESVFQISIVKYSYARLDKIFIQKI